MRARGNTTESGRFGARRRHWPPSRSRRGMLLIVVLSLIVTLSLIAYAMMFSVRVHARIADNAVRETQARFLARAAVQQSLAVLRMDDTIVDGTDEVWQDPTYFEPKELGAGIIEVSYQNPDIEGEETRIFGLEEESAKLNLNTATREQLLLLPNMDEDKVDALIDWRDEDETPGAFGAESDYYTTLYEEYDAKNANLGSVRELLLIKDFNEAILYGEDANRNGRLDPEEDDGDLSPPNDNANGILDLGLLRFVTVYSSDRNVQNDGSKRINIQKASADELKKQLKGMSKENAEAIVEYRKNNEFKGIGDLLDVTEQEKKEEDDKKKKNGTDKKKDENNETKPVPKNSSPGGSGRGGGGKSSGSSQAKPEQSNSKSNSKKDSSGGKSSGKKVFKKSDIRKWADQITVTDDETIPGLISLNSAPAEVLLTLDGLTQEDVNQILLRREAGGVAFETIGDIFELPGMNAEKFKKIDDKITTRSFQFTVRAKARLTSGRASKQIEAVVERNKDEVRILYWREI